VSPDEPDWWYGQHKRPLLVTALEPLARIYDWAAQRRLRGAEPYRAACPVICVGNFTAGGTGKTPLALRIADEARALGRRPAFLTRGYRGSLPGPVLVDIEHHTSADVGDEPMLLARAAPTMVARDRKAGAMALSAVADPPDLIIMDDGLQNPALVKDLCFAVVDASRGLGNARVIPAGPLRMNMARQLDLVDAIVLNGPNSGIALAGLRRDTQVPVLAAQITPSAHAAALSGVRVVGFAGIGNPARFEATLRGLGADVVAFLTFPDHHAFTPADCAHLVSIADGAGATLVTTEKDAVRLRGSPAHDAVRDRVTTVPIRIEFDETDAGRLAALIAAVLRPERSSQSITAPGAGL
jgi:tetraacyldisaccharide 4'-kinase